MPSMTLPEAMSLAISQQRQGRLPQAEAIYREILKAQPQHPAANHNLGLIALASGRAEEASRLIDRAIAADPAQGVFHNSLGEALRVAGRPDDAVAAFSQAARLAPADPVPHNNLGILHAAAGRTAEAEAAFLQALALNPAYEKAVLNLVAHGSPSAVRAGLERYLSAVPRDAIGAKAMLAALGSGERPDRASAAHMQRLYALRADLWGDGGGYRAPQLVAEALIPLLNAPADILDAGCGTGLIAPLIRPAAGALHGVDLSAPMLDRARRLGLYDALYQSDLVELLEDRPDAYDAIASAATLIHFGDLSPPLRAAARALRPGGVLAFTAFPNETDPDDYAVGDLEGGRGGVFFHGRRYIAAQAAAAGLTLVSLSDEIHEMRGGAPYTGLVVVCRKPV